MTIDKFQRRNRRLAEHLAQIERRRYSIAWVDSPLPSDEALREVLVAQERLLTATERFLESCADEPEVEVQRPASGQIVVRSRAVTPGFVAGRNGEFGESPALHSAPAANA